VIEILTFGNSNEKEGKKFNKESWQKLINGLPIDKKHKEKLLTLTPKTYIGLVSKITNIVLKFDL